MLVVCDKCKEEFEIREGAVELQEKLIGEGISKVYFQCPQCDQEYLVHYTTVMIQQKQRDMQKVVEQYSKLRLTDTNKAVQKYKRYQKLKNQLEKEMNRLEERVANMS